MGVVGESVVVVRPDTLGFGAAAKKGIDAELGSQDIFGGVGTSSSRARRRIGDDFTAAGITAGDAMDHATSRISRGFESLGGTLGSFGLPFSGALTRVGQRIDETSSKGDHLNKTVSALGGTFLGVGVVGAAAIAAESVHLAAGLQTADAQIASHENISVNAANNIGKAFLSTAGTVPFSANQLSSSFAPVSGELEQIAGHSLNAAQTLKFMAATGDLAEATNSDLGSTTATTGAIMQAFQVPLKGVTGLTNILFNTSRTTDVGIGQLGSTIDRLKARLGIAAPTVADLSTLLVDLNEHGVTGAKGLLVVNSAITTLLSSVPKVDAATAKAANTLESKVTSASTAAEKATSSLATAQENAAARVAKAQTALADVNDRIAASATASAPTTAQQIARQNAQTAVTAAQAAAANTVSAAQDRASSAQAKLSGLQATAGTSTNAQVKAMQLLGLQVYTATGTFVGMRSIIEQLQPKIAGMTQEQQLQTTTQIFGASASKALLDTILGGPAAYDKASKAVLDSSSAHAGAEKQAKTLSREVDVVKSSLIDEGDKAGLFLIPKLEDIAKWTAEDVRWMEKHKTIAEILAGVLGGAVAVAVGVFAINMGVKAVNATKAAGSAIGNLATTVGEKLGIIDRKTEDTDGVQESSSRQFQTAADQISESMNVASSNIVYALGIISDQLDKLVLNVTTSAEKIDSSFSSTSSTAGSASTEVSGAMERMATSTTDSGLLIIESNAKVAASYSEVATAAELSSTEAGAATEGLAAKNAAAGAAGEAGALGGAGGGLGGALKGVGGVGGVLTAATAGLVAFQGTTQLLNSNVLGLGSAVKSAGSSIANFFGVGPAQQAFRGQDLTSADVPYLQEIVAGQIKHAPLTVSEAKEALRTLHAPTDANPTAAALSSTSSTLGAKLSTVAGLQQQVYYATVAHGANSAQAKAALSSLYSTESKFLPGIAKDESLTSVNRTLFLSTAALSGLQSKQAKLASEGTVAQTEKHLAELKSTLKTQTTAGASEQTLNDTKSQITQAQNHLNELKSVASKIARDETTIKKADETKADIEKVNQQMQQLRQEIATNPPPKIQSKLTGKFRVTAK